MPEYIDREAVFHAMMMEIRPPFAVVRDFPAADVAPVVHGKNLTEHNPVDEFKCSHCGAIFRDVVLCKIDEDSGDESYYEFEFRFCPRCGMIVDLEEKI